MKIQDRVPRKKIPFGGCRTLEKGVMKKTQEQFTALAYETYCKALRGNGHDGQPLPTWKEFAADEYRQAQANAWRACVARVASEIELAYENPR